MVSYADVADNYGSEDHVAVNDIREAFRSGVTVDELPTGQIDDSVLNIALSSYREDHGSVPTAEPENTTGGNDDGGNQTTTPPGTRAGTRSLAEVRSLVRSGSVPDDVDPDTLNQARNQLRREYGSLSDARNADTNGGSVLNGVSTGVLIGLAALAALLIGGGS